MIISNEFLEEVKFAVGLRTNLSNQMISTLIGSACVDLNYLDIDCEDMNDLTKQNIILYVRANIPTQDYATAESWNKMYKSSKNRQYFCESIERLK